MTAGVGETQKEETWAPLINESTKIELLRNAPGNFMAGNISVIAINERKLQVTGRLHRQFFGYRIVL